jgi:hypothetical protein
VSARLRLNGCTIGKDLKAYPEATSAKQTGPSTA